MKYNKHRNIKTVVDEIKFDSKKEARRYCELKLLERAGEIENLELQVRFDLMVNGQKVCAYIADFRYFENGAEIIEDVKGMKKGSAYAIFRLKKKLMRACLGIEIKET